MKLIEFNDFYYSSWAGDHAMYEGQMINLKLRNIYGIFFHSLLIFDAFSYWLEFTIIAEEKCIFPLAHDLLSFFLLDTKILVC